MIDGLRVILELFQIFVITAYLNYVPAVYTLPVFGNTSDVYVGIWGDLVRYHSTMSPLAIFIFIARNVPVTLMGRHPGFPLSNPSIVF
jgi:hypothetical protein